MKLLKKVAIICVIALLCNVFSVVPATAFSNEVYESQTWDLNITSIGDSTKIPAQWHTESTVEGFEDYLHINPNCTAVSRQKYDLNSVKLVLNDLDIPSNNWMSLTFSPDGITSTHKKSNFSSGIACLLIYKDTANNKLKVHYYDENGTNSPTDYGTTLAET